MRTIIFSICLLTICHLPLKAEKKIYISRDITYAEGQKLDIYSNTRPSKRISRPVILLVHGGGFWEGDKASSFYVDLSTSFAKKGFIAVSINYRLKGKDQPYSRAVLDSCITDVMAAYAWICRNSEAYGIDTSQIFIGGDSAGGGIVVNACYDHPELFIGCIDLWGGLPGDAGWEAPIYSRQFPITTPPTLIIHGTADRIIPFATSHSLYDHLHTAGVEAYLIPLAGADHYPVQLAGQIIDSMTAFMTHIGSEPVTPSNPVKMVNPFIGTANSGNTNPGAVCPWSMASVAPFNTYDPSGGAPGSTPYVHGRPKIYGFTHLNMSGLGCGDMGIVCLMPGTGSLSSLQKSDTTPPSQLQKPGSSYSREKASPGYYAVSLDQPGIDVELTATCRTSLSSFTFPAGANYVLLDLRMGLSERKGGMLRLVSNTELEGCRNIGNICGLQSMQTVYFVIRLSRPAEEAGIRTDGKYFKGFEREVAGDDIGAYFQYHSTAREKILVKTAFSYTSMANARANMDAEQPGFDFEKTLHNAQNSWSGQLEKIRVEGGAPNDRVQFYTALYHSLLHPGRADDVNGAYRCFNSDGSALADSLGRYSVFSLWDTYRTLHPFLCLVYPALQSAMVKSLLGMSREGGWLPRWEYAAIETGAMTGDPSLPVIADTWMRGIRDFDGTAAYKAMKRNATSPEAVSYMRPGMDTWLRLGFIPENAPFVLRPFDPSPEQKNAYPFMKSKRIVWGCVSTVLEYCIADWNMAQMAGALGYHDDYQMFMKRALSYRSSFDPASTFMRPRVLDGHWLEPFDPAERKNNAFTEGAAWNYRFMVPQDVEGLIQLMGGPSAFRKKLDSCFDQGYFDITNEPDLAYPYLYNHLPGDEWRTSARLRQLLKKHFSNSPDGLPGNDDCGELSAWLLCTMMGIYPDCPGRPTYQLAIPVFDKITITLDQKYYPGGAIEILCPRKKDAKSRISSIQFNRQKNTTYSISHRDLVSGGVLTIITQ